MSFKGHSRSSKMSRFDRAYMISYYRSIVTVALSKVVGLSFHTYSQILVKTREMYIPTGIQCPRRGWLRHNFANVFSKGKTGNDEPTTRWRKYDDLLSRFERDRRRDRILISISRNIMLCWRAIKMLQTIQPSLWEHCDVVRTAKY